MKKLICPDCKGIKILKIENIEQITRECKYETNVNGESLDLISDRYNDNNSYTDISFECLDCNEYSNEIDYFVRD